MLYCLLGYKQAAKLEEEVGRLNASSALFIELGIFSKLIVLDKFQLLHKLTFFLKVCE